jgi:uncharacterized protein
MPTSMTQKTGMYQSWRHLLFVHWEVPPEEIQKTLPQGLLVDTFGGKAYLGLVPFTMKDIRPKYLPAVPCLSNFHECNVRTYVTDENGENPGVWFYSLDAANPIAVKLARCLFHLPYFNAQMSLKEQEDGTIDYKTTRTSDGASCHARWTPDATVFFAEQGTQNYFLYERYRLYAAPISGSQSALYTGLVYHDPYPLQKVVSWELQQDVASRIASNAKESPTILHYSQGVDVRVSALIRLR